MGIFIFACCKGVEGCIFAGIASKPLEYCNVNHDDIRKNTRRVANNFLYTSPSIDEISFKLEAIMYHYDTLLESNFVVSFLISDKKYLTNVHAKLVLLILCIGLAGVITLSVNALTSGMTSNLPVGERLVTTIRTNSSLPSAYDSNGQISCNKDETLTGGGYKSNFKDGLSVYQNGPSTDGKKWLVSARYTVGSAAGGSHRGPAPPLEIYGICAKLVP